MSRLFLVLLLSFLSFASAADLAVQAFRSQDGVLGMAVAERLASAFPDDLVIGPELTASLVAPVVVSGGFINPLAVSSSTADDPSSAQLTAQALGVPMAVGGVILLEGDGLRLDLGAWVRGRGHRVSLHGDLDDLDGLVRLAVGVTAHWTGLRPGPLRSLDLSGEDREVARARALVAAGFPFEALDSLESVDDLDEVDARFLHDLRSAVQGDEQGDPALAALVSLGNGDELATMAAFRRWADEGGPPVAQVWLGALARSMGDDAAAGHAFQAASTYPFGLAARAAHRATVGADEEARADLTALLGIAPDAAALLAGSFAAGSLVDLDLEDRLLERLSLAAPYLSYPFERRSFIAFDRDDALTAAQTLSVAVELAPDSDLYWTNLGWAWYLLGFIDRSEQASARAIEIDPSQYIAHFNMGLARVVGNRLEEALSSYLQAVSFDPEVDDEAIADLVAAEELYPQAAGVPFALGFLLDQEGNRTGAAEAYQRYIDRAEAQPQAAGVVEARVSEARARLAALTAPLPPIEIATGLEFSLGRRGPAVDIAQPGDPLTLRFEVSTPGDALPRRLTLSAELWEAPGTMLLSQELSVEVPTGAIGYVIDQLSLELPLDLAAGDYEIRLMVNAVEVGARTEHALTVRGAPNPLRRLLGRDLVLTGFQSGTALFTGRDLQLPVDTLLPRLLDELQQAAPIAEDVLPDIDSGRFQGMTGGAVFAESGSGDVLDFLEFLLDSGAQSSSFAFVDAYAQWAVDGAPTP